MGHQNLEDPATSKASVRHGTNIKSIVGEYTKDLR